LRRTACPGDHASAGKRAITTSAGRVDAVQADSVNLVVVESIPPTPAISTRHRDRFL